MAAILEQLGLDQTYFFQLAVFAVLFFFLGRVYFKPFLSLFEARHRKTVQDRAMAESLLSQAESKLEEYKKKMTEERAAAREELNVLLKEARDQEAALLARSRDAAKKITSEAGAALAAKAEQIKAQLDVDAEVIAQSISEKLLLRKS